MSKKEKTIKEIAGEILLYFYVLQRKNYSELEKQQFNFLIRNGIKLENKTKNELTEKYSDSDLYNALRYLENKNFVQFAKNGETNIEKAFVVIELTADGMDIIEGVKRGDGKSIYKTTFNFNLNIDSLLKLENNINLESIIKASLI